MRKTAFLLLLTTLAVSGAAFAQETEPRVVENVDVNLVLVDVTVTDRAGNHILGLTKDDFVVTENGVQQAIDSVDYFTNRRLLNAPEGSAPFKVERVKEERYFIFFFHKSTSGELYTASFGELNRAKNDTLRFVRSELQPQDRVAVAGFDSRLKLFTDFTSDREMIEKALNDAVRFGNGLLPTGERSESTSSILANLDRNRMMRRTGEIYEALEVLGDALQPIAARKALILFSPGIGEPARGNPRFLENEDHRVGRMIRSLNAANVSTYAMNLLRDVQFHPTEQTLSRLASETSGDYFRHVPNYANPLEAVEKENSGYYLLSYYTKKPKDADGYQKIEVKLRNREFRVKAREGYVY